MAPTDKKTNPNQSPSDIYASLELVHFAGWMWWAAFAFVCLLFLMWAVFGTLSHRGQGMGIILWENSRIYQASTNSSGTVSEILVSPGDLVKKDQHIATLRHLVARDKIKIAEDALHFAQTNYQTQKKTYEEELTKRQALLKKRTKTLLDTNNQLQTQLNYLLSREKILQREVNQGYATAQTLQTTRTDIDTLQQTMAENMDSLVELDEKQLDFLNTNQIELQKLSNVVIEAQQKLRELTTQVNVETGIRSPVDGIITSINSDLGEYVDAGAKLITIEEQGEGLEVYAYLPPDKGKRVRKGMVALVTPTTVKRDIYGSIYAKVTDVSRLPVSIDEVIAVVGETDLAQNLTANSAPIQVKLLLRTDPDTYSGLDWTSSKGPDQKITPGEFTFVSIELDHVHPINLLVPLYDQWVSPSSGD